MINDQYVQALYIGSYFVRDVVGQNSRHVAFDLDSLDGDANLGRTWDTSGNPD